MRLEFQTRHLDTDSLGQLCMLFLKQNDIDSELNNDSNTMGWERVTSTSRPLLVAVMGDGVYDHRPRWCHLYHAESGLNAISHHDCGLSLVFHTRGDDGFTIINKSSSMNRWEVVDLNDPRNDPMFDPFK